MRWSWSIDTQRDWQLLCVMQAWFWREEMLMRYFGGFEIANATDEKET
jgi:hypothetical protein